jgi:hypothetical protein
MLFSKKFKMNDKDYEMKIGVRARLDFKNAGIDIKNKEQMSDEETLYKMCAIACKTDVETFIDDLDNSDITEDELVKIVMEAIDLGTNKGKKKAEDTIKANSEDSEEKNLSTQTIVTENSTQNVESN